MDDDSAVEHLMHEIDADDEEILQILIDELMDSDSDEEVQWGGSRKGKAPNKNRDFAKAYADLVADYFSGQDSVYDERDFRRHFRVSRTVCD